MIYNVGSFKLMSAVAVDNTTKYSDSVTFERCVGYAGLLITSSAAGTITVTQQCSLDNQTWYDAVDKNNSAIGAVQVITTSATSRYVQFDPVIAKFIRFKVVEGGASATNVTLTLISQEVR